MSVKCLLIGSPARGGVCAQDVEDALRCRLLGSFLGSDLGSPTRNLAGSSGDRSKVSLRKRKLDPHIVRLHHVRCPAACGLDEVNIDFRGELTFAN